MLLLFRTCAVLRLDEKYMAQKIHFIFNELNTQW